jgi:predicted RNase H-like HicB family nuclease
MLNIKTECEEDGRWIGLVPALPGVFAYGATQFEARANVQALALCEIADRLAKGETLPREVAAAFAPA